MTPITLKRLSRAVAVAVLLSLNSPGHAQSFGSTEINRGLHPGASAPYDGAPFSHRYHYGTGAFLYFNGDARRLWTLDYLDRLDRAEKFGYRIPDPPRGWCNPPGPRSTTIFIGFPCR